MGHAEDSARYQADTVNVGPGQRFDVIWTARKPGKWLVPLPYPASHRQQPMSNSRGAEALMPVLDVQ